MAYYPIKCPYCLKLHTNETVRFNLADFVPISSKATSKSTSEPVDSIYEMSPANWDDSTENESSPFEQRKNNQLPVDGYYTINELYNIFGSENIKTETRPVNAMPLLTDYAFNGDLLTRVTITSVADGFETVKEYRNRYCDCADNPKLNMSSGIVPTYVILLMGSSNAGKTMYLTSLFHELMREGGYSLPPTSDPNRSIARLSLTVLSEGTTDTSLEKMMENLFEYGLLPRTTNYMYNEPLTMDITIRFNKSGITKKALLYMRDMPGEFLTNQERQNEIFQIANQFPRFDGFMMMFDPMTFSDSVFPIVNKDTERVQRKQINQLRTVLVKSIVPLMPDAMINQPTAAMITKGDKFFDPKYNRALKGKGIRFSNPLLSASQREGFDKPYFDEVDAGVKDILNVLSKNIAELMGAYFNNAFFSMVSALSRVPIDIADDNERVITPTAISPWRVTDPMLRLLMKLKILPPFDETVSRKKIGESDEERTARRYKNNVTLNDWGEKYCTGWVNIGTND